MNKATFTTFFLALFAFSLNAQNNPPAPVPDHSYKPLTLKLNEDGSKYVERLTKTTQYFSIAKALRPKRTSGYTHFTSSISKPRCRLFRSKRAAVPTKA